ncbi:MAG: antibiotic biosynthesis monooxygenase [Gemmatimonadota bacterium]
MIARTWHGRVPRSKAEAYYRYLERTGLADYRSTPGNKGVLVLREDVGDVTHFTLTSLWESLEAVQRFAGADFTTAHYYAEDDDFLLEREPGVRHAVVLLAELQK